MCKKTSDLAKCQGWYFNKVAENTTNFNNILTGDMDHKPSQNKEFTFIFKLHIYMFKGLLLFCTSWV
jgi:hypothetical protein